MCKSNGCHFTPKPRRCPACGKKFVGTETFCGDCQFKSSLVGWWFTALAIMAILVAILVAVQP